MGTRSHTLKTNHSSCKTLGIENRSLQPAPSGHFRVDSLMPDSHIGRGAARPGFVSVGLQRGRARAAPARGSSVGPSVGSAAPPQVTAGTRRSYQGHAAPQPRAQPGIPNPPPCSFHGLDHASHPGTSGIEHSLHRWVQELNRALCLPHRPSSGYWEASPPEPSPAPQRQAQSGSRTLCNSLMSRYILHS